MSEFLKKLKVKPGSKVNLEKLNTGWNEKYSSHKKAEPEIQKYLIKMDKLQYKMYAESKHSLLIVLQGLDAAGKDGVIKHVLAGMNPQGCTVTPFKQPTSEEQSHDFLWRVHPHAPRKGSVSIFNRSHYEDTLVTLVHGSISDKECAKRFQLINDFERLLFEENNTTILKFFLHISKEEQLKRFGKRLQDPTHHWKISESDYSERKFWNDYTKAYEKLLKNTSTEHAPWIIIPADHKWFRNLVISQIITETLENLKMKMPAPMVDINRIRRKYHQSRRLEKHNKRKYGN
ncbi:MAG: polyphosphate kinase 2 family protein [Pseudobdellovibrio sp.]